MEDQNKIDDLIKMLDAGMSKGVGHINVDCDETEEKAKSVQTMGCTDCSPLHWPAAFLPFTRVWMTTNNKQEEFYHGSKYSTG